MTQFPNLDLFATLLNHKLPLYVSPIPDPKGTFNRRSHNELESHTRLCVSTFPSHSLSDKQNKNSSVQSGIDRPILAQQNVVSRTTQSVDIITNNSPNKTKPTQTAPRKVFASKSKSSATSRMGIIQQSIRD